LDHGKIEPPDQAQGNPTLAAPCYYARLQFGQQGKTVASTMAQQVFLEIRNIARSDITLPEQRAEAAKRIEQFKTDLSVARVWPAVAERQKESLRRTLQRAAARHDLTTEENSVYAEALDVLIGQAR